MSNYGIEWAGKVRENSIGRLVYTKVHAWDGKTTLCGKPEEWGEWVSEGDSAQTRCKKCEKLTS